MSQISLNHLTQQLRNTYLTIKSSSKTLFKKHDNKNNSDLFLIYPRRVKKKDNKVLINLSRNAITSSVTTHYIAPRDPIVLCHGLYGFDKIGPESMPFFQVQYWGGIENELAKLGAKVIVTKVPSTGSVWERANTLHSILKTILEGRHVNLIAHSMGGLDCRYLISHINDKPYHINSLTTISTPHRGSPVMDWFRDNIGVGMASAIVAAMEKNSTQQNKSLMKQIIRLVDTEAYANLSTDYCKHHFNPNTPNDPNVAYYSYGGNATFPPWSLLNLPSKWIREKEGINDGLVSVESAKWGKYIKTLDADHWDLNGQRYRWKHTRFFNDKAKFNTVDFYMELATFLYHQGY